ncbi:MAG: helix-turn-helix transcriptional regulator, partial [Candidatus Peribacteraceae bacterium]|nr:helix-turn-helix transcriptional regulator [Candidatus Peribacteraceae bacterium]
MISCMAEDMKNLIGKRIRERRDALGMSQLDLAKTAEKESATYIALIESGERNVSTADLLKIAQALGTNIAFLTSDDPKAAPVADIRYALNAEKHLTKEDRDTLLHII